MSQITKKALAGSLKKHSLKKPLDKITVTDIAEDCQVNRQTFYYHFQDIPALLQEMMEEKVNVLIENHCALGRPLDCLKPALQYGAAHKQAVLHVYRAIPRETFLLYLNRFAQHMVGEYFDSISKTVSMPTDDAAILMRYYKGTLVGCLLDWLDDGMRYDLETEIERLCFLMEGNGARAIQKTAQA